MIYLDNAATSFPKPAPVYEAVRRALEEIGASPGRASHRRARQAAAMVTEARRKTACLLDIADPDRVLFTKNATEGLNLALKGWLRPGDRVLTSSVEHNSMVRPLAALASQGIEVVRIACSSRGHLDLEGFRRSLDPPPRLVAMTHVCNVNGALQPIEAVAALCADRGLPLLLDAAQSAGLLPISVQRLEVAMLACSAHKALLGPPGLGILYIRPGLEVPPLLQGGTGSLSESEAQPEQCPDRYESGTPNLPAIAGLAAGLDFILDRGVETIRSRELEMCRHLERELERLPGVEVQKPVERGSGAVSLTIAGLHPETIAHVLDERFDIAVRAGLHCAPEAHRTLGTFPEGTVRVSPGFSTTREDVEVFIEAVRAVVQFRR
jgi:cysteine desulfurase family protein